MFRMRLFKWLGIVGLLLLVLALLTLAPVDRTPYQETSYYKQMQEQLDTLPSSSSASGVLQVGWSKVSITPSMPTNLAGYGLRDATEKVSDSLWARALVLTNGNSKQVWVTLDLLIFPPAVVQELDSGFTALGIKPAQVFYSATHTHSGAGGWASGLAGRILAGKNQPKYIKWLAAQVLQTVQQAQEQVQPVEVAFSKYEVPRLVENRTMKDKGTVDPWLRVVHFKKQDGHKAILATYAGHANCLSSHELSISRDYPGYLVDALEQDDRIDFALYNAGAVGSMRVPQYDLRNFELAAYTGQTLARHIISDTTTLDWQSTVRLNSLKVNVPLRSPHLRIAKNWRLRPWIFRALFGPWRVNLSLCRIGSIVLVGTPCDFSGELVPYLEQHAKKRHDDLIITSFNGGYIGYITPDTYYDLQKSETREMNWFGPYNGAYFSESIAALLDRI